MPCDLVRSSKLVQGNSAAIGFCVNVQPIDQRVVRLLIQPGFIFAVSLQQRAPSSAVTKLVQVIAEGDNIPKIVSASPSRIDVGRINLLEVLSAGEDAGLRANPLTELLRLPADPLVERRLMCCDPLPDLLHLLFSLLLGFVGILVLEHLVDCCPPVDGCAN